ncbi:reverse transcriptase N-terminal domain-containing protein [Azotobacter chroococcum]
MTGPARRAQAATPRSGAPSHAEPNWPQSWCWIESDVKRLQVRIAKATREGRWGKVQALQRLLTRSYSGKLLAVKRVTENRGRKHRESTARSGRLRSPNRREHRR